MQQTGWYKAHLYNHMDHYFGKQIAWIILSFACSIKMEIAWSIPSPRGLSVLASFCCGNNLHCLLPNLSGLLEQALTSCSHCAKAAGQKLRCWLLSALLILAQFHGPSLILGPWLNGQSPSAACCSPGRGQKLKGEGGKPASPSKCSAQVWGKSDLVVHQ